MAFSCSSDNDKGSGGGADSVTFTFNGQPKSLTNIIVAEEGGGTEVYLGVTANIGTSTDNIVSFGTYHADVGADAIFGFSFIIDGQTYFPNGNLTNIVQTNNSNTLKDRLAELCLTWKELNIQLQTEVLTSSIKKFPLIKNPASKEAGFFYHDKMLIKVPALFWRFHP